MSAENQGATAETDEQEPHVAATRRVRLQKISHDFRHVPVPNGSEQAGAIQAVKEAGARFAALIEERAPHTAEKTLAIRKVQEATMWATHAISHR